MCIILRVVLVENYLVKLLEYWPSPSLTMQIIVLVLRTEYILNVRLQYWEMLMRLTLSALRMIDFNN